MTAMRFIPFALALLLAAPAQACEDRAAAEAAVLSKDHIAAAVLYERIDLAPDCDDAFRAWLAEALAREEFRRAMFETTTLADRATGLEASLTYFPHWRTHVELANIALEEGDTTAEARALQAALLRLDEGPEHHTASEAEIAALFERATVAVRLAEAVVEPPRTQRGDAGGSSRPRSAASLSRRSRCRSPSSMTAQASMPPAPSMPNNCSTICWPLNRPGSAWWAIPTPRAPRITI